MPILRLSSGATPGLVLFELGMGLLTLFLINLLVTLVEGVSLTLLRWNNFPRSIVISLLMNTLSSLVAGMLLILLQATPIVWLVTSFLLSVLIEALVLGKVQPVWGYKNWLFSLTANLSSFLILILPAYLFSLYD
jgi:cytochrome b subunit of formate dehydrogenase